MFTLRVPLEQFPDAVKRHAGTGGYPPIYEMSTENAHLVSAGFPERGFIITSLSEEEAKFETFRRQLEAEGFRLYPGVWDIPRQPLSPLPPGLGEEEVYIAAVGFVTPDAEEPYLWVDTYPYPPEEEELLEDLVEWFSETGEVRVESPEEFRATYPYNVVITSVSETLDRSSPLVE
ncbi:MAG: hypothetical protein ABIN58_03370 [candidate division WOR-3 bacterium]